MMDRSFRSYAAHQSERVPFMDEQLIPRSASIQLSALTEKYEPSPAEFGDRSSLPETRTKQPEQEEYEVEKIIAERCTKKGLEYLVRREGYSPLYDTWEPKRALTNAPEVVAKWLRSHDVKQLL